MNCDKVLIHDAARPNPSKKMITKIIQCLKRNHAVCPVIKVTDATKRVQKNIIFKNIRKKDTKIMLKHHKGFTYKKIYTKHLKNLYNSFDDDCFFIY